MRYILFIAFMLVLTLLIISPFLPGDYDPVCNPVSTAIQLWSVFGSIVCIPASVWLYRTRKLDTGITTSDNRFLRSARATIWTGFGAMIPVLFLVFLGISKVFGLILTIFVILFTRLLLRRAVDTNPVNLQRAFLPVAVIGMQIWLLCFPFVINSLLTTWSRNSAITNSNELINDIEAYAERHGFYPSTLNGTWKDYYPNVSGVEKYHYTFDDNTYHLYFRQPRFLLDQIGTDEYVVYNPTGKHLILSHSAWNLDFTPHQRMHNQGWYRAHHTPFANWKYFWFD